MVGPVHPVVAELLSEEEHDPRPALIERQGMETMIP
jgi:hypothetical protein